MKHWGFLPALFTALMLLVLIALTQVENLSQEVINWDESTFMVVAVDLLDGNLPYLGLYDNKPPAMFFWLAGVMWVFGENLIVVRLFGDVCIWVSAGFVAVLCSKRGRWFPGLAGGALLIAAHDINFGQYTSSELPAAALLMLALGLIVLQRQNPWAVAGAGLMVSLAVLTRSNLGVVAVAFGFYFGMRALLGRQWHDWKVLGFYIGAGLVPVVLLIAIYALQGGLMELRLATVDVPLAYAAGQSTLREALAEHFTLWLWVMGNRPFQYGLLTLLAIAGMVVTLTVPRWVGWTWADVIPLWIMALSVLIAIGVTGSVYLSYWMQILPMLAVFSGVALIAVSHRFWLQTILSGLVMIAAFKGLGPDPRPALALITDPQAIISKHVLRQAAVQIAPTLSPEDEIWALERHLILVYLDRDPISPVAAHPENIVRPVIINPLERTGFVAPDPLGRIYDSRPAYVIAAQASAPGYMIDTARFESFLAESYAIFYQSDSVTAYRRIGHNGWQP